VALSDENFEASVSDAVPLSAEIEGPTSLTSVVAGNDVTDECRRRPDDLAWSKQELRAAQLADSDIKAVAAWLSETTEKPPWEQVAIYSRTTKALWHQWSGLCLHEGILYRQFWSADGLSTSLQLVVPYQYRMEFIRLAQEYDGRSPQQTTYRSSSPKDRLLAWMVRRRLSFSTHLPALHAVPQWATATSRSIKADACRRTLRESLHRHHWSSSPFFKRSCLFAYGDGPFHEVGGSNTDEEPYSAYRGSCPDGERLFQIRSTPTAAE